ncbi:MAG: [FeFe] hydrogenase H-cluster radical SAM maturase HydG [Candidatus Margulisbacteria bacterium]|nr:[FeFe] hydrogenase H-cluster radical SAM maturase HydG [Candidatus Margulisiibacteriota bacterium]
MIDNSKIEDILITPCNQSKIQEILDKSKKLQRLTLEEVATLLNVEDSENINKIFQAAHQVKEDIYGKRLVIFAPLYISNLCQNECLYCAFRSSNKDIVRKVLTQEEIKNETEQLLKTGQKRVLLVAGETYPQEGFDYILKSIATIYSAKDGKNQIRRLNVNLAPLEIPEFKLLKEAKIGTYQLFQETYHKPTYQKVHLKGPKANYQYRLETIGRAFQAGIDDVGMGILFGLYDYKYEVLALLSHTEHLEKKFGMGPHTISVPRLEPAVGSDISTHPPYPVDDLTFKKIIAILRLAVPYTGMILSTRETPEIRRAAFDLGISQISAGSKTNPGGYCDQTSAAQFSLGDHRSLDSVIYDILEKGYLPSFCTSCYRLGRTGLDFMEYAKPGDIKKKCLPNALFTFQEYLEDYASPKTKALGVEIISKETSSLPIEIKEKAKILLAKVKDNQRDLYI